MTTAPIKPPSTLDGTKREMHEDYVHQHHWRNAADEAEAAKMGMWLFLSTEVLLFAGFFCAYAWGRMVHYDTWRAASHTYLDWQLGAVNTVVLLLKLGWEYAPKIADGKLPGRNFWYYDPQGTHDHLFLSVYWISTATHGLHVLIGVIVISYAMFWTAKGRYGPKNFMFVENTGLYWHIVDVIWIFLFPMMYLV